MACRRIFLPFLGNIGRLGKKSCATLPIPFIMKGIEVKTEWSVKKMTDVVAFGELLIDFTPNLGTHPLTYTPNPGGAPANVLTAVKRLGGSSAFVGKVGDDSFGRMLKGVLEENGILTQGLLLDPRYATTLAFVHLDQQGDRSFSFYRTLGADTQMSPQELPKELIQHCRIFHFGSLTLTSGPSHDATLQALSWAKEAGVTVSCDPNWRPLLWESPEDYRREMAQVLPFAQVVKMSQEELALITGIPGEAEAAREVLSQGVEVLVVTMGPRGCTVYTGEGSCHLPTYHTKVVDTTGSGDAFWGAFLSRLVGREKGIASLSLEELAEYADFANAAGALCATRYGAIPALATLEEIEHCRRTIPLEKE